MAGRRFKDHDAPKAKLNKAAWAKMRRVLRYMAPYRGQQVLGMICLVITSGLISARLASTLTNAR